jgi:histidyl-tRNA synthetase
VGELKYRALRGMPDVLPDQAEKARWVEEKAKKVFDIFGYREIRTPILEDTEVFTRSIGEDTDIVEKEMYSFRDRGGKDISLRPEGTASIIRAYIEHGFSNLSDVVKLFYSGPMFRGERPQKGRLRQFYQIGAEIIGSSEAYSDAELIITLNSIFLALGVKDHTILINSLGCGEDRSAYEKTLREYLLKKKDHLCEDCLRRSKVNVLRVLDCKKAQCKSVLKDAPSIKDMLCSGCASSYAELKAILKKEDIPLSEKKDLVRGLDYYTGAIFEAVHPSLGAQDAIAAGGRYDSLTARMGGADVGATGFAIGVERLLLALEGDKVRPGLPGVFVVCAGDSARQVAFGLVNRLRRSGIACEMDLSGRSFKGQMRKAGREKREYVVIVGEDEIKRGVFTLKNMENGEQVALKEEALIKKLKEGEKAL